MNSRNLSQFEFCPRLPALAIAGPPPLQPIRDATKHYFSRGVREVLSGGSITAPTDFLNEAAYAGFLYPSGDPYTLAQDYSCWLDGALRIVEELGLQLRPLPTLAFPNRLHIGVENAYLDSLGSLHLFLIGSDAEEEKWPLLLAQLAEPLVIELHLFPLPSARGGRLSTPLTIAYRHPLTGSLRLAALDDEKGFSPKWTRVGRWEEEFRWGDWRDGIDRDQCIHQIYRPFTIYPERDPDALREIREDAAAIAAAIPLPQPRLRENCPICPYNTICHADRAEKETISHVNTNARSLVPTN